ncbi:MAG: TonB family protein [Thiobacillaceae bacterium]
MIHPSGAQNLAAGAMAMLVHGLFLLGLVFSVTWRSLPELPVYADLWAELPPLPEAPEPPPPQPVEPVAPPEPLPAPPAPQPKTDIQLEMKKEEERLRLQAEEWERARIEAKQRRAREAERRQRELEEARARRQEAERQRQEESSRRQEEARRLAQERARRELDEALARQLQEDLAGEARLLERGAGSQAEAAARLKMIEDYRDRIRNKIHGYLRLPPNLSGNPEVVYQVRLLPDGEVLRLTLLKSSGQPAYDRQVELAILKASPLPLPPDRELANAFREDLILKFRPYDEAGAGA